MVSSDLFIYLLCVHAVCFQAVIGLIDGGLILLLPETKGKTLPETIEDVENMHRYGPLTITRRQKPTGNVNNGRRNGRQ